MKPAELTALAQHLRLTPRMRLFCELLAQDPDRNNSAAARGAGCAEATAHVTANRWLKLPQVQEYFTALTTAAVALAEARTGQTIASMAEVLEVMSVALRVKPGDYMTVDGEVDVEKVRNAPAGAVRRFEVVTTTTEEGQVIRRDRIELADNLRAGELLRGHHLEHDPDGADKALRLGRRRIVLELLVDARKRGAMDRLAADSRRAIDVAAKRLR